SQHAVLPPGRQLCTWPLCEAMWPWAHSAAILAAADPVAHLWGRRREDGCHGADAVCVGCHGALRGRLYRLLDRKRHNDYPVRSAQTGLSTYLGDDLDDLLVQSALRCRGA